MREFDKERDLNEMGFEVARWAELGEVRVKQQNVIAIQMSVLCFQDFTFIFKISFVQITNHMAE